MIEFSRIREGDKVTVSYTVKSVDASDETILVGSDLGLGWFGVDHIATHEARDIVVGDMVKTMYGTGEVLAMFGDKFWCNVTSDGPATFRREHLERA